MPQYYVEDSHPAIIEPWEWEQVQAELERRKNSRNWHRQTSPFSGKILLPTAAGFSVPRPGTPPTATAGSFGSVTANSRGNTEAKRPI